jgi:hypothetical protein
VTTRRLMMGLVLLFMWGCDGGERERAEARAARQAEFAAARPSLLDSALARLDGDPAATVATLLPWLFVADDSIRAVYQSAMAAVKDAEERAEEQALREEMRALPAKGSAAQHVAILTRLITLRPDSAQYRERLTHYRKEAIAERLIEQQRRAEEARLDGLARKWTYGSYTDEMTGRPRKYATLASENTVEFAFPYGGKQRATLTVRTRPQGGGSVFMRLERGQIICHAYDCRVRVRFDEGAPIPWSANPPSDHSSEGVFLGSYTDFLGRMRRAKTVRIEVRVYQEGTRVFEFSVEGYSHARYTEA